MSRLSPSARHRRLRQQTRELRAAISAVDYLAYGTLHRRMKTCGQPTCRCTTDESARHGPYYEWTRRKDGRLVHSNLNQEQAELVERAIANQRMVLDLIRRWHEETEALILEIKQSG